MKMIRIITLLAVGLFCQITLAQETPDPVTPLENTEQMMEEKIRQEAKEAKEAMKRIEKAEREAKKAEKAQKKAGLRQYKKS